MSIAKRRAPAVIKKRRKIFDQGQRDRDNTGTPLWLARRIVEALMRLAPPNGRLCFDPTRGKPPGAFYRYLPAPKAWCERQSGRDFYDYRGPKAYWVISNIPWHWRKSTPIMRRCFAYSEKHVALLVPLRLGIGTRVRRKLARDFEFGLRHLIFVPPYDYERYVNGKKKLFRGLAAGGLSIVVAHWERGWTGPVEFIDWDK